MLDRLLLAGFVSSALAMESSSNDVGQASRERSGSSDSTTSSFSRIMSISALSSYVSSWYDNSKEGNSVRTRAEDQTDSMSPSLMYGLMFGRGDSSSSTSQLGLSQVPNHISILKSDITKFKMILFVFFEHVSVFIHVNY